MDFQADIDPSVLRAAEESAVWNEVDGKGEDPESAASAATRKRGATGEAGASAGAAPPPRQRARTTGLIVTVTIGQVRHVAAGVEVLLKPKQGKPFWKLASELPLAFSLWDWCELDIDTETGKVLDLRKKPYIQAADAKKALVDFGIEEIPKGLRDAKGKIETDKFKFILSKLHTPLPLAPLHWGRALLRICLVFGEETASLMSETAAQMIWERFDGGDELALVFADWGDKLFPTSEHRFDFLTPRKGNPLEGSLSDEVLNIFDAIRELRTLVFRNGILGEFKPVNPVWERFQLVEPNGMLRLYHGSAFPDEKDFSELKSKMSLVTADYERIKPDVKTEKLSDGSIMRSIGGAHLFSDESLFRLLKSDDIDKIELFGLRELSVVSLMATQRCSTLFWAFCTSFPGIERIYPTSELFQWVFDRLLIGFDSALRKNQEFDDGTKYEHYEPRSWQDLLKLTGHNKKQWSRGTQIVLFDHPEDLECFHALVPKAFVRGVHFNHLTCKEQLIPSGNTTSTEVCLMTQAIRGRVETVFVVVRPDTYGPRVAETAFLAEKKFVRIMAPPKDKLLN